MTIFVKLNNIVIYYKTMVSVSFLPSKLFQYTKVGVISILIIISYLFDYNLITSWIVFSVIIAVVFCFLTLFLPDPDLFLFKKRYLQISDKKMLIMDNNKCVIKEIIYDDIQRIMIQFEKRRNRMYLKIEGINKEDSVTLRLVEFWFASIFSNAPHVVNVYKLDSMIHNTIFESKLDHVTVDTVKKELHILE